MWSSRPNLRVRSFFTRRFTRISRYPAYVSTHQHTSLAYFSIRQIVLHPQIHKNISIPCIRQHTSAYVACILQHTSDRSSPADSQEYLDTPHTSAHISIRHLHTSAYVSSFLTSRFTRISQYPAFVFKNIYIYVMHYEIFQPRMSV
jgi:peptidoglycan/LPS O-acetylase OafA/YrhL